MSEESGEADVIETVLRAAAGCGRFQPRTGPGDDAAVLDGGEVVTTDILVEGVHFDARLAAGDVGWKLVAVNASDIGAMGCRPTWAVLTLSLPRPLDIGWVASFAVGLREALGTWEITLIGGDTTRSPGPRIAGMTMGGRGLRPVLRSGGRPGDGLWVTGTLGDAAAGFLGVVPGHSPPAEGLTWLRRPRPPVAFGAALAEAGLVSAMMDLSDGLLQDLPRLCAMSGTGAEVDPALLPAGSALAEATDPVPFQVGFGDDYQLLFAAHPGTDAAIQALAAAQGVRVTRIGALRAGTGVTLSSRPWPRPSFTHFGAEV